jgi:predicted dehydrogenase
VKRAGGGDDGVLIDNGTHSVDIVGYLIGPISRVFLVEGR